MMMVNRGAACADALVVFQLLPSFADCGSAPAAIA
jgi:hypothetical protein